MSIGVIILLAFGAILVVFLVYGYSLPAKWRLESRMVVPMPQEALFHYLQQIRHWEEWTIWNRENSQQFSFSYEGPIAGPGATQLWKAKKQQGKTQIRSVSPPDKIGVLFVFGMSQQAIESELQLMPRGAETEVVWSAWGDAGSNPSRRIMAKMFLPYMAKDFEMSLQRLTNLAPSIQRP